MSEKRLGNTVKAVRLARQMTMAELAAECGLTKGFISQLESGTSNPSLNTLRKIAEALKVTVTDLLDAAESDGLVENVATEVLRPTILHEAPGPPEAAGVAELSLGPNGIHSLVTLPQGSRLSHFATSSKIEKHGSAVGTILAGRISLRQEQTVLELSRGAVASWDAAAGYTIEASGPAGASLVLFIPRGCRLPTFEAGRAGARIVTTVRSESPVPARSAVSPSPRRGIPVSTISGGPDAHRSRTPEGPLRLVAMRAQRLAERKGQS